MCAQMGAIQFHESLHGGLASRGTGTATIEVKLARQLAFLEQQPFYGVFLDLKKVFDAMDRDRVLRLLKGHGVGPRMLALI